MLNHVPSDLLDSLSTGFYCRRISKDGKRTYVFFNRMMKDIFGSEDVVSSPHWKQKDDDDHDNIALCTIEPYRIEHSLVNEKGETFRWLVFLKRKIEYSEDENSYYIATTVIDVTERKREELLLAKSRLSLRIATDAGKMSTWDLDVPSRVFTITNGVDIHDRPISLEEHIMLRHYEDSDDMSYSDLLDVMLGKKASGESLYMMEDPKTGEILYRKSFYSGINENGVVKHIIGITQDVTEVYQQRETITKNRDELNLALEAGRISAWTYNVNEEMFYTLYGEALAGDGKSLEQILNMLHPDDHQKLIDSLNDIISEKINHIEFVFRFRTSDPALNFHYFDSRMSGRIKNGKVFQIIGTQRDVTEEVIHQEQLEEFSLKTRLINEATNSVIWDYDLERHVLLTYSDRALLPHQPITMDKYLEYVHPNNREMVREYFIKADNRALDDFYFEMKLMLPDHDTYRWVAASGIAVKNKKGEIIKYTGVRRDITEVTLLNQTLKSENVLKDTVVNNMQEGLVLFTTDYKIVWANEAAANSFHPVVNKEYCIPGMSCEKMTKHICTLSEGHCLLYDAIETQSVQNVKRWYDDDCCLEMTAIPVVDGMGKLSNVLLKFNDVTEYHRIIEEQKKMRAIAEDSANFVNNLMNLMPSPMYLIDPVDGYKIIKANDAFCKVFGLGHEDVIGKTNTDILGKKMATKYDIYDRMIMTDRSGGAISYEATLTLDNVETTWLLHKAVVRINGKRLILSISTDISELKDMNKKLAIAKDKALEADRLKTAFLANMSHEIRTPLNAIVGFSDLLTRTEDLNTKIEFNKIIQDNTEMLLRLISDILDLSKIEAGNTEFRRDLVEVSAYFNELTASLALKVTNPEVTFIVDNPYHTCYVNMDKLRFGQVVTNFVSNAIKYTHKGYIKVGYCIERQGVTIRVEDTGDGIPADKRSRVFSRFDKLDSMAQGTGLGLSIAKLLTETGGGKIWFESQEGVGSTFYSWKPFSDIRVLDADMTNKPADKPKSREKAVPKKNNRVIRKILIVEDNESNYRLLQRILTQYEIEWAHNGIEAIDRVAKSHYDVVLMDIKMPIMDGLDATRQIRKFNSAIPIIAVTANAYAIDKEDALRAGCNDFLAKPIMAEDVYNLLAKI